MPFTNEDLLYYGSLHRCKSGDFSLVVKKMLKDLTLLLQFRYEQFWAELRASDRLKRLMQSCLQILPRKAFSLYARKTVSSS